MDWRQAAGYIDRCVIYQNARREKHIYRLRAIKKDELGVYAVLQDLKVKNSYIRAAISGLMPLTGDVDNEQ